MRGNKGFFSKKVLNLSRKFVILSLLKKGEKSINSRHFAINSWIATTCVRKSRNDK